MLTLESLTQLELWIKNQKDFLIELLNEKDVLSGNIADNHEDGLKKLKDFLLIQDYRKWQTQYSSLYLKQAQLKYVYESWYQSCSDNCKPKLKAIAELLNELLISLDQNHHKKWWPNIFSPFQPDFLKDSTPKTGLLCKFTNHISLPFLTGGMISFFDKDRIKFSGSVPLTAFLFSVKEQIKESLNRYFEATQLQIGTVDAEKIKKLDELKEKVLLHNDALFLLPDFFSLYYPEQPFDDTPKFAITRLRTQELLEAFTYLLAPGSLFLQKRICEILGLKIEFNPETMRAPRKDSVFGCL